MNNHSANWYLTTEVPCGTGSAGSPGLQGTNQNCCLREEKSSNHQNQLQHSLSAATTQSTQQWAHSHSKEQTPNAQQMWSLRDWFHSFPNKRFHQGAMLSRATDFCTDLRHQPDMLSKKEPAKEGVGRALGKASSHRTSAAGNKKGLCQRQLWFLSHLSLLFQRCELP